jgi:hypothetical protein
MKPTIKLLIILLISLSLTLSQDQTNQTNQTDQTNQTSIQYYQIGDIITGKSTDVNQGRGYHMFNIGKVDKKYLFI